MADADCGVGSEEEHEFLMAACVSVPVEGNRAA